jgi:hypothetical protein
VCHPVELESWVTRRLFCGELQGFGVHIRPIGTHHQGENLEALNISRAASKRPILRRFSPYARASPSLRQALTRGLPPWQRGARLSGQKAVALQGGRYTLEIVDRQPLPALLVRTPALALSDL